MLFNSLQFLFFLPVVYSLYIVVPHERRWLLLLTASYVFYASWRVEYLLLLSLSTVGDYFFARRMSAESTLERRRPYLVCSVVLNLSILFFFKYFSFFSDLVAPLLGVFGLGFGLPSFSFLLPVGLSFYTFQSLSYTIDVYYGRIAAEKSLGHFAAFISFFPQLVAGPIERAKNLLPQFYEHFRFSPAQFVSALQLMLWGFFKKIVISDRLAIIVDSVFSHPADFQGLSLIIAVFSFSLQIYCDFSGYTDIAIGTAQLFGFRFQNNFRQPYLASSVSDFWTRWHISLSTWFRDYLYRPLGGDGRGHVNPTFYLVRNILVTFLVSGLWHGANWTFILWGLAHAVAYLLHRLWIGWRFPLWNPLAVGLTFCFVSFSWVFFRAHSVGDAFLVYSRLFSFENNGIGWIYDFHGLQAMVHTLRMVGWEMVILGGSLCILWGVNILQEKGSVRAQLANSPLWFRWSVYYLILIGCLFFGGHSISQSFIYFQF